jgi:hypothetical protein
LPAAATVRGVAAAYALINSRDLRRVLSLRGSESSVEPAVGIEGGIVNTLVLLEWTFPGCLSSIDGVTDRGSRLIGEAAGRAAAARRQGRGPSLLACREETASVWSLPKPKPATAG